jgi:YHS domain-containing protein
LEDHKFAFYLSKKTMRIFIVSIFLLKAVFCLSQINELRTRHFNIKKNLAIEGYDPISYFDGKPVEGLEDNRYTYRGVEYLFSSSANLNKFKSNSDKYEPAYGGWCAYAMGETGEKVKVDPETFKIIDGKLYLFYNFWGTNTLKDWNKNEMALKAQGDRNWKSIFH